MIRYNGTHQLYGGFLSHGPPNHDVFGSWLHWIRRCKWKVRKSAADSALLKREFENQYHKYMFYINVFALFFTICTHTYTHMIIHIYMHMFVHIYVNIYLFISTYTCTCRGIHVYIYIIYLHTPLCILYWSAIYLVWISELLHAPTGSSIVLLWLAQPQKGNALCKTQSGRVDVRGSCLIIMENHHVW